MLLHLCSCIDHLKLNDFKVFIYVSSIHCADLADGNWFYCISRMVIFIYVEPGKPAVDMNAIGVAAVAIQVVQNCCKNPFRNVAKIRVPTLKHIQLVPCLIYALTDYE